MRDCFGRGARVGPYLAARESQGILIHITDFKGGERSALLDSHRCPLRARSTSYQLMFSTLQLWYAVDTGSPALAGYQSSEISRFERQSLVEYMALFSKGVGIPIYISSYTYIRAT